MSAPPSGLEAALAAGRFAVTAEVTPPVSADPADLLRLAEPLRGLVDAVNVTDGARGRAHLASLAAAALLVRAGIEPVLQLTCRDRNRIALQGDLLGAAALGIRNVMVLKGDAPAEDDGDPAKPVFDLDSRGLLEIAKGMEAGTLPGGRVIAAPPRFFLGAAETPIEPPPGWRPTGLAAKVAAGARFVQTQFCFDAAIVRRWVAGIEAAGLGGQVHLLIGIGPLASARSARWMREKLFGTLIPDAVVARLDQAAAPEEEGIRIGAELMQELAAMPGVAGVHVMATRAGAPLAEMIRASGLR